MDTVQYRSHNCNALRASDIGKEVKLAGWLANLRNFGSMYFLSLRDHYGSTQIYIPASAALELLEQAAKLKQESVLIIEGIVQSRGKDINPNMPTGEIEVLCKSLHVESAVQELPFPLNDIMPPEEMRLKYRFLDLRRPKLQKNIALRFQLMQELRNFLASKNFLEIQTPILTASSPEGARDFVVPSRLHPGKFYALPQAPQQYKQLLMCSGFDRYFQIAPCFRDEDARADRSPGEFYQLDMEMAFITQDELFLILEEMFEVVTPKVCEKKIVQIPFPRIPYKEAMESYGNDKPDIRFELKMQDITTIFAESEFKAFAAQSQDPKGCVKAIRLPGAAAQSRKFFKKAEAVSQEHGAKGLAYLQFEEGEVKGSIAKFLSEAELEALRQSFGIETGDALVLCAGSRKTVNEALGKTRVWLARELGLIDENILSFCWIVDFPMYEWNEEEEKLDFCHNPFSMPQGGMEALKEKDPLDIYAYQYDIVCNGIELSSGAIRNHRPELMYEAFKLVGYSKEDVDARFGHMISAFSYGAPPHGGIAPGFDRMLMIFADEPNIREVIAFPMNQKAQDPMMASPATILQSQLDELHLSIREPEKKESK